MRRQAKKVYRNIPGVSFMDRFNTYFHAIVSPFSSPPPNIPDNNTFPVVVGTMFKHDTFNVAASLDGSNTWFLILDVTPPYQIVAGVNGAVENFILYEGLNLNQGPPDAASPVPSEWPALVQLAGVANQMRPSGIGLKVFYEGATLEDSGEMCAAYLTAERYKAWTTSVAGPTYAALKSQLTAGYLAVNAHRGIETCYRPCSPDYLEWWDLVNGEIGPYSYDGFIQGDSTPTTGFIHLLQDVADAATSGVSFTPFLPPSQGGTSAPIGFNDPEDLAALNDITLDAVSYYPPFNRGYLIIAGTGMAEDALMRVEAIMHFEAQPLTNSLVFGSAQPSPSDPMALAHGLSESAHVPSTTLPSSPLSGMAQIGFTSPAPVVQHAGAETIQRIVQSNSGSNPGGGSLVSQTAGSSGSSPGFMDTLFKYAPQFIDKGIDYLGKFFGDSSSSGSSAAEGAMKELGDLVPDISEAAELAGLAAL